MRNDYEAFTDRGEGAESGNPRGEGGPSFSTPSPHRDPAVGHTFIQWKGTTVCMDVYLPCGCSPHIDGSFAYYIRCGCGQTWQTGQSVDMTLVPDDAVAAISPLVIREEDDDGGP